MDWHNNPKRLYGFVMVLDYSCMMYLEFTEDEKLETIINCHKRAIEYFGGCTEVILYDNRKTAVKERDEQGHSIKRFLDFHQTSLHGVMMLD
ncbi:DDE-type integrase/transposase/recombinase [Brevibacillus marinus]|uniref:DDE-type integrase/transposase/recombinase n=1 Tax=Brevibacillus marinus TaxID=2496837 RepID=UPI000F834FAC|nr:DDE-type integrase/transposase/recombinase [Brevibacillus marinus]